MIYIEDEFGNRKDIIVAAVPKLGTVYLVRAVARVDVGINLSNISEGAYTFDEKAGGIEGITLTKVFFYNTNTHFDTCHAGAHFGV